MATKKPTLKEQNEQLRAELAALANARDLAAQLKSMTARAGNFERRVDELSAELVALHETNKHLADGTWDQMMTERETVCGLLDCRENSIVTTLQVLAADIAPENGETISQAVDRIQSEAGGYLEYKKISDEQADDIYKLTNALDAAVSDRRELLRRFGLTDMQWSAQGGACWADLEVA